MASLSPFRIGKEPTKQQYHLVRRAVENHWRGAGGDLTLSQVYHDRAKKVVPFWKRGYVRRFMANNYLPKDQRPAARARFLKNTSPILGTITGSGGPSGTRGGRQQDLGGVDYDRYSTGGARPVKRGSRRTFPRKYPKNERQLENLQQRIREICQDTYGLGGGYAAIINEQLEEYARAERNVIDLMESSLKNVQTKTRDNVVPYLNRQGIPTTLDLKRRKELHPGWLPKILPPGFLFRIRRDLRSADIPHGGTRSRKLGALFRLYVEPLVAMILFLTSLIYLAGGMLGGLDSFLTLSNLMWFVIFLLSGYWWGVRNGFHVVGWQFLFAGSPSDEALLGMMIFVGFPSIFMGFTGQTLLISWIPLLGTILEAASPGTFFLISGIVGILGIYHAEEMHHQVAGAMFAGRAAAGKVREVGGRINRAPQGLRGRGNYEAQDLEAMIEELRAAKNVTFREGEIGEVGKSDIEDFLSRAESRLEGGDLDNARAQIGNVVTNYGDRLASVLGKSRIEQIREEAYG